MVLTVLRWIGGVLAGLLAAGALVSFGIFIAFDLPHWLERARQIRSMLYVLALFWFNLEIWGRVIWTITHWNG